MAKAVPMIASLAALALAACSSEAPAPQATDAGADAAATGDSAAATPAATGTAMAAAMEPQAFVDTMAASDMFELESSRLAATTAKDPAVKDFAQMMIADHTKSSAELKTAAGQATPAVTAAPKLTAMQQSDLAALKGADAGFDALYMQKQVAGHEQALATLQGYAANGTAAPLKAFAEKTAPVVSRHLAKARGIKPGG